MILKKEHRFVIVLEGFCNSFDIFSIMLALDRKLVERGMKLAGFLSLTNKSWQTRKIQSV